MTAYRPKPLKRRPTASSVRLSLECRCGYSRTLWVDPDAPVIQAAGEHDWSLRDGYWECPQCNKDPE